MRLTAQCWPNANANSNPNSNSNSNFDSNPNPNPTPSAQVSFKLRELLVRAPIHQAAKHQAQLGATSGAPEHAIDAPRCLERLRKAMTRTGDAAGEPDSWMPVALERSVVNYQVFDMIEAKSVASVALDGSLELVVPLSGVRAVRLEQVSARAGERDD